MDEDRCYNAKLLHEMYSSPMNKLLMLFLLPILQQINRVNKLFQLDRASPVKLLQELMSLYESIMTRVIRPTTRPFSGKTA